METKMESQESDKDQSLQQVDAEKSGQQQNVLTGSSAQLTQQQQYSQSSIPIDYDQVKHKQPIKPYIYQFFKLLQFIINFNYSIQNSLITMIMISFLTPNIVDALIWTVPNVVSILVRPYLVRYVHSVHKSYRVRSEALMVNFFLFIGAIGALVIAQSTLMNNSRKGFHILRIFVCSIGWTLTGTSFELCEFFIDKFKESLQQQFYIKKVVKIINDKKSDDANSSSTQYNDQQELTMINFDEQQTSLSRFTFLGSLTGYLLVFLLFTFTFKNKLKMKSFFEMGSVAYSITGFLTLGCAILCHVIISYVGIPKSDSSIKTKSVPFRLSFSMNYYLPGWSQLKSISIRGLAFLLVHFIVGFLMDVMFIYTTMWLAVSESTSEMKESEANFFGIQSGVGCLIMFTVIHYGGLSKPAFPWKITVFKLICLLCTMQFLVAFWYNSFLFYQILIIVLAVFCSHYENQIESELEQIEPQIKESKQLVERVEKFAVLNMLPFVTMILLGRDDIQDCLVWCAGLVLVIVGLLVCFDFGTSGKIGGETTEQKAKTE